MKYKLIAMDIDGTLVNSEKVITPRTKKALFDAMDNGMVVVLASGRPDYGMKALAEELELYTRGGYISAYNGAKIIDCKTGEVVVSKPLNSAALPEIYDIARKMNVALLTHEGDHVLTETPEDEYVQLEAKINHMEVKAIESFAEYVDFSVYKYIATDKPESLLEKEDIIRDALNGKCVAYRSCGFFLEIVEPGVDKGDSLKKLAEVLNIPIEQTIAFGDGLNDISMIEASGAGVAMANAEEKVKAVANYITASNDEDGIADFLEKYCV